MKKNTGAFYLALGLKHFSLERPRVLRMSKCHIWLAPELLFVLSWGSFFSCAYFLFFCLLFLFLFYFVLECVARYRAALLRRLICGTLINGISVQVSGWEEVEEKREKTWNICTKDPLTLLHGTCELITERERESRSESWGLVPDTCTDDSMRYGGTSPSRHSPSVRLTFLSSSSSPLLVCLAPRPSFSTNSLGKNLAEYVNMLCKENV